MLGIIGIMENKKVYYSISRTDNINYLPLAYFLPAEIFLACPTLCKIPRCFGEVAKSETVVNLIKSDQFFVEITDSVAAMTFPHFGFRGWKAKNCAFGFKKVSKRLETDEPAGEMVRIMFSMAPIIRPFQK